MSEYIFGREAIDFFEKTSSLKPLLISTYALWQGWADGKSMEREKILKARDY